MIIIGWIVKGLLVLGMIGVVIVFFKAFAELCKSPKSQQINIKINFIPEEPKKEDKSSTKNNPSSKK